MLTRAGRNWWMSAATDARRTVSLGGNVFHSWNDASDSSSSGSVAVTIKPATTVSVSVGPAFDRTDTNAQYVRTLTTSNAGGTTAHYVFAKLSASDVAMTTRVNVMANDRLSFQLYLQPFVARGQYTDFKELVAAGTDRFVALSSQTLTALGTDKPDFDPALFDLHAVMRWELRRGSTLYLVWTQQRSGAAGFGPGRYQTLTQALNGSADNTLAAKFTYWMGR